MPKHEKSEPEKSSNSQRRDPAEIFLGSREHGMTTERTQAFLDLLAEAKRKTEQSK